MKPFEPEETVRALDVCRAQYAREAGRVEPSPSRLRKNSLKQVTYGMF
jgi:hypothetical protein